MCPYTLYKKRMKEYFLYEGMSDREANIEARKHCVFIQKMGFLLIQKEEIRWNPLNKVVQNHRNGDIHHKLTNIERKKRGLPVPWTEAIGRKELLEVEIP